MMSISLLQLALNGLVHALFIEVNPIPIKTAMNVLGMEVGSFRLPLTEMAATNLVVLKKELTNYGL